MGGETDDGELWTQEKLMKSFQESRRSWKGTPSKSSSGWGVTMGSEGSTTSTSDSDSPELVPSSPSSSSSSSPSLLPAAALTSCDYGQTKVNILFCGWPGISYSMELMRALDRKIGMEAIDACGCDEGPRGNSSKAHILVLNNHDPSKIHPVLESLRHELRHTTISHAQCDPRNRHDLEMVLPVEELATFKGALTLVDVDWFRDEQVDRGPSANFSLTSASMLKMDALILNCQLNLRHMIQNISPSSDQSGMIFISEKLSGESRCTKYEDRARLPLGSSVNSSSFAAKVLAQEAILPGSMRIYNKVDEVCRLHVVETSMFAEKGEWVSYAQLQARAADLQCVLLGYYDEPDGKVDSYVRLTLNPQGWDAKNEKKVWNDERGECRLVLAASIDFHKLLSSMNV
jgi:hypothetical protein